MTFLKKGERKRANRIPNKVFLNKFPQDSSVVGIFSSDLRSPIIVYSSGEKHDKKFHKHK